MGEIVEIAREALTTIRLRRLRCALPANAQIDAREIS
jgi:hypothetical protein